MINIIMPSPPVSGSSAKCRLIIVKVNPSSELFIVVVYPFISVSVVNPLMLEKGMELAQATDKRRALMLGDSLTSDIAAAKNAGIDACWFNPKGAANDKGLPIAYEIASLDEVDAILDGTEGEA